MDRFWSKVDKSGECWCWEASTRNKWGYGQFWIDGKMRSAHRVSYELENGSIPEGMCVLHKCDNPICVRPDHLFAGTVAENNADKAKKGRAIGVPQKGSDNGNSKLCELDVWLIRQCESTHQQIADFFDISRPLVSLIKSRKAWAHVE